MRRQPENSKYQRKSQCAKCLLKRTASNTESEIDNKQPPLSQRRICIFGPEASCPLAKELGGCGARPKLQFRESKAWQWGARVYLLSCWIHPYPASRASSMRGLRSLCQTRRDCTPMPCLSLPILPAGLVPAGLHSLCLSASEGCSAQTVHS